MENTDEIIVFAKFCKCELGFPISSLIKEVLAFYKIKLVHLPYNSILMLVIFTHLCEAFLGVSPDFDLFHFFYVLNKLGKVTIGGDSFQLGNKRTELYIEFPMRSSWKTW